MDGSQKLPQRLLSTVTRAAGPQPAHPHAGARDCRLDPIRRRHRRGGPAHRRARPARGAADDRAGRRGPGSGRQVEAVLRVDAIFGTDLPTAPGFAPIGHPCLHAVAREGCTRRRCHRGTERSDLEPWRDNGTKLALVRSGRCGPPACDPAGRCDRRRHGVAPDPVRRGLERSRRSEQRKSMITADPDLGLALEGRREPASARTHQAGRRRSLGRCSTITVSRCATSRPAAIKMICYNFMPVVDWTRTELYHPLPGGGRALRFNAHEYAAFDCFMLRTSRRRGGSPAGRDGAGAHVGSRKASETDKATSAVQHHGRPARRVRSLRHPGPAADVAALQGHLRRHALRQHLARFLREVMPTAEEVGIRMAIHPDDPPRPLMGLPRIVSRRRDLASITVAVDCVANGVTLCTGSLGAGAQNDVGAITRQCRKPHPFRASAQRRQGAGRLVHGSRPPGWRHRHGRHRRA